MIFGFQKFTLNPKITEKIKKKKKEKIKRKTIFRFFFDSCLFVERSRKTDEENLKLRGRFFRKKFFKFLVNHVENLQIFFLYKRFAGFYVRFRIAVCTVCYWYFGFEIFRVVGKKIGDDNDLLMQTKKKETFF